MHLEKHEMSERVVAVVGCGIVGSTVARLAAEAGATVLAIDKAPRPYGELESQVPLWLAPTVGGFIGRIDENLAHENIIFVPRTEVGRDITRVELEALGLDVIVATGRSLAAVGLEGALPATDLLTWFNHHGHPGYPGPHLSVPDRVAVYGQSLAAVEAARLLTLELHRRKLAGLGHRVGLQALYREGIAATLVRLGVSTTTLPIAVHLIVPGGLDQLLTEAPPELRAVAIENLRSRELVTLWPGFELEGLERAGHDLTGLRLANRRAESFATQLPCDLLVDASLTSNPSDSLEVFSRLPPSLSQKLWEARLVAPRSEDAAVARGEALAEELALAIRALVEPLVAGLPPAVAGTLERARGWSATRHSAIGYTDFVDWIGQTHRAWLA